ncbi:multidrug and toxin extrusion protein 1-like [Syngnathus typhle]|uniref:multidrug and toxin extrusion protein 1-like n=1 Tax=Syngnathus typhle TaxID=161592 RepID=UPI002A6AE7F0|nr:multidrug and toxin extrusion protein 1-like [Syngnathus typhle]
MVETSEEARQDSEANGASSRGMWLGRIRGFIPSSYRTEVILLLMLAGPVVLSQMMIFMISIISMVFCGHLGKTQFAAVSLAIAVVNVTGIAVGSGLSLTCDTLISQTFGSGNLKRVGVILQRGVLIILLACFPCWAVLINTEPFLLAVKQSHEVASLAQVYVKIVMFSLPAAFMYQLLGRYLQNQGIIWPQVVTGVIGTILNAFVNYVLLHLLQLGVPGSAAANAMSQCVFSITLLAYIWWKGLHKPTWGGWSRECLEEWGPFVKLAMPSMLMFCLEWWAFELGGCLAGTISEVELGAQSVIYNLTLVAFMFPIGMATGASVRVGNALGAGNSVQAKLSCKVSIICTSAVACFVGLSLTLSRNVVGYIFTTDPNILKRTADVMVVFGVMHLADAIAGVSGGVFRGVGKQKVGAVSNLVGHYFIGFPIGVSLLFKTQLGVAQRRAGVQVKAEDTVEMLDCEPVVPAPSPRCESTAEDQQIPEQHETAVTIVGDVLTVKQLLLKRGLILLIFVAILAAGIIASHFLVGGLKDACPVTTTQPSPAMHARRPSPDHTPVLRAPRPSSNPAPAAQASKTLLWTHKPPTLSPATQALRLPSDLAEGAQAVSPSFYPPQAVQPFPPPSESALVS